MTKYNIIPSYVSKFVQTDANVFFLYYYYYNEFIFTELFLSEIGLCEKGQY